MDNATTFGRQAGTYAAARPTYPDALFAWIADQSPAHGAVWDVGTGSGQAAQSLAAHFGQVQATDIDAAQLEHAVAHPRITYTAAPAEASGLADASVDAVTVATALHWFDHPAFWPEVARVARPGALFCGWTYGGGHADREIEAVLLDPIRAILKPYWSDGNRLSWRGYDPEELAMPFEPVAMPTFACDLSWTPAQIGTFMRSWSAHQRARLDGHADTLAAIEREALAKLGDTPVRYVLPLRQIAARVPAH